MLKQLITRLSRHADGTPCERILLVALMFILTLAVNVTVAEAMKKPLVESDEQGFFLCKSQSDENIAAQGCDGSGTVCWCCYEDGCYFCDTKVWGKAGCWSFRRPPRIGDVIKTPEGSITISPGPSGGSRKPQIMTPMPKLEVAPAR